MGGDLKQKQLYEQLQGGAEELKAETIEAVCGGAHDFTGTLSTFSVHFYVVFQSTSCNWL